MTTPKIFVQLDHNELTRPRAAKVETTLEKFKEAAEVVQRDPSLAASEAE